MSKKLEVTVSDSGVQFGGAWFSHESITGYTAEQLNSGDCHVTGNQYMQWLSQDASLSQLAALREELADVSKENDRLDTANVEIDETRKYLQQRLADAERRNATILGILQMVKDNGGAMEEHEWERIEAALNKPEEAKS